MKNLYALLTILSLSGCLNDPKTMSAEANSTELKATVFYINSFDYCPEKVILGIYLDGGTVSVKAHYPGEKSFHFGLDNSVQLSINNSKKSISKEEYEYIEENKVIKVFIGAPHPNDSNAKFLPFKGAEELTLRLMIKKWIDCESLEMREKEDIKKFITEIDEERIRQVIYEFDRPNAWLTNWRDNNTRSSISGMNVKNEYIVISGYNIAREKMIAPSACEESNDCDEFWYKYEVRVAYAKDKRLEGEVINAVKKHAYVSPMNESDVGLFVLSEIPRSEAQESFGSKYYLHEISWPRNIYCFRNKLKDIGIVTLDTIMYRKEGRWNEECVTTD